jgi:hypothetical protein
MTEPTKLKQTPRAGLLGFIAPLAVGAALIAAPSTARAEGPVTGTAKGIVGGALLGAEVVMMPMGIAGLKPWWPYLVFGGVGAVGGAVGGWAVEQAAPPAEAPLYMLAGGLALIIPTLVLTLNATTKKDYGDETTPAPVTDPSKPGEPAPDGTTVTVTSDARKQLKLKRKRATEQRVPTAAVDLSGDAVRMGIPAIVIKPMYSDVERSMFGVAQQTEVRIPVFNAAF